MSRRIRNNRKSSNLQNRKFENGLPAENKKQILGFFLIVLCILISLSIFSYSDTDHSVTDNLDYKSLFTRESFSSSKYISNWLGITGALISNLFVKNGFGYFSIVIPLIFILIGFQLIRKKKILDYLNLSVYLLILMVLLSSLMGLVKLSFGSGTVGYAFIGRSGEYFSNISNHIFGLIGSYTLLVIFTFITIFLMIDRDIAKTFARLRNFIDIFKEKYQNAREEIKEKRQAEKLKSLQSEEKISIPRDKTKRILADEEHEIKDTKINRPEEIPLIIEDKTKISETSQTEKTGAEIKGLKTEQLKPKTQKHPASAILQDQDDEGLNQEELPDFKFPSLDLLDSLAKEVSEEISDEELKENGKLLQAKLLNFDVKIEKVIATPGPVVTLYELVPAEDVKLSRIESLEDDIALAMKAKGIRMIIPIPGKGTVGVEIPNHKPSVVKIKSVIGSKNYFDTSNQLPIALGKTISGEIYLDDLARMPHLLIAGSTGSGKSVGINNIITSLLYKLHPSDLKFILIDPKKIELNQYDRLRNHYLAVSRDVNENIITTPQNAVMILKSIELEMEKRYERLANATVRNIQDYNKKYSEGKLKDDENIKHAKMPYLIVIIDELADLMITAAREVEEPIARLAQLARAVGIHLILATQRPSVDVITGVIKANFSARIAYLVSSKVDSRTILDMNGAEQLLGQGDMLYLPAGVAKPLRIQSPFISVDEVERITNFIYSQKGFSKPYQLPSVIANKKKSYLADADRDELFEEAAKLIIRYKQGSVSFLQRRLKVGYARAARIVDELESVGIVGPSDGSKAREILIETEEELEQVLQSLG